MALFPGIDVPLEVLQQIVRQLDPVSLIALSQTSRAWRTLIRPLQHDFAQRLLALEVTPEEGGIVPLFSERDYTITPPWDSDVWRTNRYACCGCMKLRSHMMFDNQAILRRPQRKPPPGSIEAARAALSDWEPLEPSVRWRRIQQRAAEDQDARRSWARAHRRDTEPTGPPAHPFAIVDPAPESAYREVERRLAGVSRQKRRCIECQRLRGYWSRNSNSRFELVTGAVRVPVIVSRQIRVQGDWDRHFPGLFPPVPVDRLPRNWAVQGRETPGFVSSLYVICCPSCGTWQEQSAFRQWDLLQYGMRYIQGPVSPLLCNRCRLTVDRDPSSLAEELAAGVIAMLQNHRKDLLSRLGFGWRLIYKDFNSHRAAQTGHHAVLSKWKEQGHEILAGLNWIDGGRDRVRMEESDLEDLRRRLHRYRELIFNEVDPETRAEVLQSWFRVWVEDYDLLEGLHYWLGQRIAEVVRDPRCVLKYVLEGAPYCA